MRILVAGGSGVLGARVVDRLVRAQHVVFATTRRRERAPAIESRGATPVLMDALVPDQVERAVEVAEPDVVVHQLTDLASFDFAGNARLRVEGTAHLVDAARSHGVTRMIAESVSWAYQPGEGPADETVPLARNAEGAPAFAAVELLESAVRSLDDGVVLRYGILYGPGTWYAPEGELFRNAGKGEVVATTAWTSFVHVDDAADATVAALTWPPGLVNIVDDASTHVDEWAPRLVEHAGGTVSSITSLTEGRGASNARARSLGWTPAHPTWRDAWQRPAS